jgi:8-oxo-dGTP pyrophosphatase MutT (NUDIX family)
MKSRDNNPWITHRTETRYENDWIRVTHCEVTDPSGGEGIYGVVHFKNRAVGVIPVDEEGYTFLVGQYRYTLNSYEWEIPAGGCPEGESPEETACRELAEETGLVASTLEPLILNMALSNSISDERAFVYRARDLTQGVPRPEQTEDLALKRLPLEEAVQMVLDGEITDSMSVAGLLRIALK